VFGFDYNNHEDLLNYFSKYNDLNSMYYRGADWADNALVMLPEGEFFGPYIPFYEGKYRVICTGKNLKGLSLHSNYDVDEGMFEEPEVVSRTDSKAEWVFSVPENRDSCAVHVRNTLDENATVDGILIERTGRE
jgi:hypothetical protein